MKFRSDFVTNSSSSSFIAFNVCNLELFDYLQSLGIKITNTKHGEFDASMEVKLPSGEKMEFWQMEEADYIPSPSKNTMAVWVMLLLLMEIETVYPSKELDEYTEFTIELIKILNAAGITDLDMDNCKDWTKEMLEEQLTKSVAHMNRSTESAEIEVCSGFEGEVCFLEYSTARNGYELNLWMNDESDDEGCDIDGLRIAITGKTELFENREELKEYIENLGGIVVSSISNNTDMVICNDLNSTSSKMKKAEEFCIPVISEKGFICRYGDPAEFDINKECENLYELLFECTYEGEFYAMFHEWGIGNIARNKPTKGGAQ